MVKYSQDIPPVMRTNHRFLKAESKIIALSKIDGVTDARVGFDYAAGGIFVEFKLYDELFRAEFARNITLINLGIPGKKSPEREEGTFCDSERVYLYVLGKSRARALSRLAH